MLKVVGASWEQTRATSYILILFTFCGLLIIIFGGSMSLSEADGNYAASVYWEKDTGYRIEFWGQGNKLEEVPLGSARGYYRQDIASNGWSKVEIETNAAFEDSIQAYSAGLLEGSLTWQLLFWRWKNTIEAVCEEYVDECEDIRSQLSAWGERMRTTAQDQASLEPFWHQINLFFAQIDGLITGWNYAIRRNRAKHMEIANVDFLWLQLLATDVPLPDHASLVPQSPSLTSALIKLHRKSNSSEEEILIGQTTARPYRDMLRMVKRYIFRFRMTAVETSGLIPGVELEFTGYPGAVTSQDDLYSVRSREGRHKLIVMGSAIGHGMSVSKTVHFRGRKRRSLEEKVAGTLRALASTRLARDGRTWAAHFTRGRGGASIDKQWVILDLTKLAPPVNEPQGLLWVVEQSHGIIASSDLSVTFRDKSYWVSVGVPHHPEVRLSQDMTPHSESERERVFDKCRMNCTKRDEVYHMIRNAVPVAEDLVGARADLYKEKPAPFGVIDTKLITGSRTMAAKWEITAGPVHAANTSAAEEPPAGAASPFQWSTSAFFQSVAHLGHPDIWCFEPQTTDWIY